MSDAAAERRVRARTRGRFPAVLRAAGLADREAVINDVSDGGLFVALQLSSEEARAPLGRVVGSDSSVEVQCIWRDGTTLSAVCRAARVSTNGLGLSFTQSEPLLVSALLAEFRAPPHPVQVKAQVDRDAVLNTLKDIVLIWVPARFNAFAKQAESRLVSRASQSRSNAEQTPFFDAISELERSRAEVEAGLTEALQTRLDHLGESIESQTAKDIEPNSGQLSLVDKDEFERFLSVADMTAKAEIHHAPELYSLSRRLSSIAGVVIDNTNNPIAPASLVAPFHDGMRHSPMAPEALGIVYRSFDDLVLGSVEELYALADEALKAAGIESSEAPATDHLAAYRADGPKGHDLGRSGKGTNPDKPDVLTADGAFSDRDMLTVPREVSSHQERASSENHGAASGGSSPLASAPYDASPLGDHSTSVEHSRPATGSEQVWGQPNSGDEPVWTPARAPNPPLASPSLKQELKVPGEEQPLSGEMVSPGTAVSSAFSVGGGPLPIPAQFQIPQSTDTAFGTAHSVLGLFRSFGGSSPPSERLADTSAVAGMAPAASVFSGGAPFAGGEHAAPVDVEQLVGILNQLQVAPTSQDGSEPFRGRLRDALNAGDDGPRSIVGEMGDAVELVMGLFEAFREDLEVCGELKTRLDMLEPATHKVALLDASFFEVTDHPARQLLNQLARLVPELGHEAWPTKDFWHEVDELLAPLLKNFERDVSLYLEVLRELDQVVAGQFETFKTNARAVIEACDAQQAFVHARRGLDGTKTDEAGARGVSKEWAIWLNRTARLEPGERLELCESGDELKRVTLAWIGEGHSSFVFVDQCGEKTLTLSRQELAMQLRRGSASIINAADLPLVDRALNRVLQDLHGLLERRATRDLRTGLLNRKVLLTRLRDALNHPTQNADGVVTLGLQVADYGEVLETYGQEAADSLLRQVAQGIRGVLGPERVLACVDESTLVTFLRDTTLQSAEKIADEVYKAISVLQVSWGDAPPHAPTVRASLVVALPGENPMTVLQSIEENLLKTDLADGVVADTLPMAKMEAGNVDYADLLQKMLSSDQLQLRCHRIVPLSAGRRDRSYFEILLGFRDEQGEIVPAAELVRAAETTGLMRAVDRWVIRHTLRWMAENRRWLRKVSGFAINLSSSSLSDPSLVEYLLEQLTNTGVPPGKIIFEITEAAAVDDVSHSQNFVRTLSEIGARFALDDFGSGQMSYASLKKLPVEYVKIDSMFVRDVERDEADVAFVEAVNKIAHFMGKKTVAEFVQSASTVARLRQIGVDLGQGFFIEKPSFLEDVTEEMLASPPVVLAAPDTFPEEAPDQASVSAEETLRL